MSLKFDETSTYACINKDDCIRKKSSSGGVFTLLAEYVLSMNGIVFGVCFAKDHRVKHQEITNIEELELSRGSKYVQSNIGDTMKKAKEYLEAGRPVFFTGTPCQIIGLKLFLRKEYDLLYTMDIICHGVPSPMLWEKYLHEQKEKVTFVEFRNKEQGWKNFRIVIGKGDKKYDSYFGDDYYMKAFLKNYSLRPSCYNCIAKKERVMSDITIGDYWGVQDIDPDMDDDLGTSLAFVNSDKGEKLFEIIKKQMNWKNVSGEKASQYNPCLIKSVKEPVKREKFWRLIYSNKSMKQAYLLTEEGTIVRRTLRKIKHLIKGANK